METARDIMRSALSLGACDKSGGVTDWRSLCWLFFTPQGREFCQENNFPGIGMFRGMGDGVRPYGLYVDAGNVEVSNPGDIALVGDTEAVIAIDDNTRVHKVILMHGGKARIEASNYAVILVVDISGGEVVMDKDNTVVIL